jgi:hypothetical protein
MAAKQHSQTQQYQIKNLLKVEQHQTAIANLLKASDTNSSS